MYLNIHGIFWDLQIYKMGDLCLEDLSINIVVCVNGDISPV